jgi:hypothetical protein
MADDHLCVDARIFDEPDVGVHAAADDTGEV